MPSLCLLRQSHHQQHTKETREHAPKSPRLHATRHTRTNTHANTHTQTKWAEVTAFRRSCRSRLACEVRSEQRCFFAIAHSRRHHGRVDLLIEPKTVSHVGQHIICQLYFCEHRSRNSFLNLLGVLHALRRVWRTCRLPPQTQTFTLRHDFRPINHAV